MEKLRGIDIIVPMWDAAEGQGNRSHYRVAGFAKVRVTDYKLAGGNWISARFLAYAHCAE